MIACCGLNCSTCEAYLATQENDDEMRKVVAEKWTKLYETDITPEQINCHGCISEGPHFFYSESMCKIRQCCREKKIASCAFCPDYQCDILKEFLSVVPKAEEALEKLRKHMDTTT